LKAIERERERGRVKKMSEEVGGGRGEGDIETEDRWTIKSI
jgi:hypothetical protein